MTSNRIGRSPRFLIWSTTFLACLAMASSGRSQEPAKPSPTATDVVYGPFERNTLDFWKAESSTPAPLVVYIHGGGFRGGDKKSINANTLRQLLDSGISVAAIHYRLIQQERLPAAHHDARRALQFLRFKAEDWNIDKGRVAAFGGSAGAQLCMWLAFHDEMANPSASDLVERESTRLTCVATTGGQTTRDFDLWIKWIPGYDKPHRPLSEFFGDRTEDEIRAVVGEISALPLVSPDDPPIYMRYNMAPGDPAPSDPKKVEGWRVHHVVFGVKLKEKMDGIGVEADLSYPGARSKYGSMVEFFKAKLLGD